MPTKFKPVCLGRYVMNNTLAAINDIRGDTKNCGNSAIV